MALQVESGDRLTLVEQEGLGVCGAECKTIATAAEEVLGDRDTDLGELLWKVRCAGSCSPLLPAWRRLMTGLGAGQPRTRL
jgi:hypothetical protein